MLNYKGEPLIGKTILFSLVVLSFIIDRVQTTDFEIQSVTNHPVPLIVIVDERNIFHFNVSLSSTGKQTPEIAQVTASVEDTHLAYFVSGQATEVKVGENETLSVVLKGKLPGRTVLTLQARSANVTSNAVPYSVFVEREQHVIDKAFTGVVILLVVLANIGMGCKVDLSVVKATLKRPVAPSIGLCSQFLFMPLIGFSMAYSLDLEPGTALGFFALGCAPGGSASNAYTHFLNGNVSLSVTMTLISSLAALAFIPLWLFTLGRLIYSKGNIHIPFENIFISLVGIVLPILVGLILQHKLPKVAKVFIKAVKYIMVVFFIFVFSVGVYANLYVFYLINFQVLLAAALLPYLGFIFGSLFAFLTRQKLEDIVAIALETGIQNTGIPIILCRLSLTGPDRDTSIVSPIVSAIFTPIPIAFAILYVQGKEWRRKRLEGRRREVIDDDTCGDRVQIGDTGFGGTDKRLMDDTDGE